MMTKAMGLTRWSYGVILLLFTALAQAGHGELQLRNFTPTVKTVNISLQGAKSVMPHLERVYGLISQILQTSRLHVVRVPTTEDPTASVVIPTLERLDIHISMPTPDSENSRSYSFDLRTKLKGRSEKKQRFIYFPDDADLLYHALQQHFTKLLDLEVRSSSDATISPENKQTSTIQYNSPLDLDIDAHPAISNILSTNRIIALPVENLEPLKLSAEEPIEKEPIAISAEKESIELQPTAISAKQEIELRNLTPAVKSVEILLRGSIREQSVLDEIYAMISEILQTSRLSVIRVPIAENTTTTPAIKLYEHLEIIIQANSPEQPEQPYLIQLSFQEKNKTSTAQQQTFEYTNENSSEFYEQLRIYMSKHINLSPRYTTQ